MDVAAGHAREDATGDVAGTIAARAVLRRTAPSEAGSTIEERRVVAVSIVTVEAKVEAEAESMIIEGTVEVKADEARVSTPSTLVPMAMII